jgi:hypothetical protein
MKLKRIITTTALLYILIACTEEIKVTPFAYPQVFAGEEFQGWTIRSVQMLQKNKGTRPIQLNTCVTDDIYIFYNNPDKSYQVIEGNTKCDPTDPNVVVQSNWGFTNSTASLTIIMPLLADQPLPFVLHEIDETKMVLDIYFDDNESNYRFNFRKASVE